MFCFVSVYVDDLAKLQNNRIGTFIILYDDDVLLLARSVAALQKLLLPCEQEFESTDMAINVKNRRSAYRCET